ncbi:MAG: hypothetical protein OHK0024_14980 [Thalassobaculales bacterium]
MQGYAAYAKTARTTETPRSVEHRLLGEVTADLMAADRSPGNRRKLLDAVLRNKKMWDTFLIELSDAANQLPKETRAGLLSIGIFVNRETARVLENQTDPKVLIEINQTIMQGLR